MYRFLAFAAALVPRLAMAGDVTVSLPTTPVPHAISADFIGLSFETKRILPDHTYPGGHLFSPANTHLVELFKTLQIRSLRIGGNTADRANVPIPGTEEIDELFAFAKAADARVIYTLRMKDTAPETLVPTAKYLYDRHAKQLSHLVVGNEPNVYYKTFDEYQAALAHYLKVISAAVPDARFCGACTTNAAPTWPAQLAKSAAPLNLTLLAQHNYPAGNGQKATDPDAAVDKLLSDLSPQYTKLLAQLREGGHTLPVRLEETNNYYLGGAPNASNTFASALWGLDYLHWWAAAGIAGLNFHASDYFPKTPDDKAVWYVPFSRAPDKTTPPTFFVHPLGYAIKAFALVTPDGAVSVPVALPTATPNVTAYATRTTPQTGAPVTYLTIINKAAPEMTLTLPHALVATHTLALTAPAKNATENITLGSGTLSPTGGFTGQWTPTAKEEKLRVPGFSALLIQLKPAN